MESVMSFGINQKVFVSNKLEICIYEEYPARIELSYINGAK